MNEENEWGQLIRKSRGLERKEMRTGKVCNDDGLQTNLVVWKSNGKWLPWSRTQVITFLMWTCSQLLVSVLTEYNMTFNKYDSYYQDLLFLWVSVRSTIYVSWVSSWWLCPFTYSLYTWWLVYFGQHLYFFVSLCNTSFECHHTAPSF